MPWRCRMIERPKNAADWLAIRPGDMWIEDDVESDDVIRSYVAPRYAGKKPLLVRLPGPVVFPIYGPATTDGQPWQVEGEPPNVTLSPSIACHGVYHGYIRNGEITDDIEGRRYNDDGVLIRDGQRR